MSLDKFTLLKHVFSGKLSLVGDTPRDIIKYEKLLKRYTTYTPGVFNYADSIGHEEAYETIIDDLFYKHNSGLKDHLQLILRTFVGRLLKESKDEDA